MTTHADHHIRFAVVLFDIPRHLPSGNSSWTLVHTLYTVLTVKIRYTVVTFYNENDPTLCSNSRAMLYGTL